MPYMNKSNYFGDFQKFLKFSKFFHCKIFQYTVQQASVLPWLKWQEQRVGTSQGGALKRGANIILLKPLTPQCYIVPLSFELCHAQ